LALPQQHRLRGHRPFDRIYRQGRRYQSELILLRLLDQVPSLLPPSDRARPPSPWRCAVVVSAKVSKRAVQRNRLRRLLHTHLSQCDPAPERPQWLLFTLRPGAAEAEPHQLLKECTNVLRQAGLIP
jgi:ribonuclease P protein component